MPAHTHTEGTLCPRAHRCIRRCWSVCRGRGETRTHACHAPAHSACTHAMRHAAHRYVSACKLHAIASRYYDRATNCDRFARAPRVYNRSCALGCGVCTQFPADASACNRTLLLYDDAITAGLGYTARLWALALLVAVQEKRVLISMPHPTARWCGRPPHTLGCYYAPITHCPLPAAAAINATKWSTRGSTLGLEGRRAHSAAHLRISTSQIHRSIFWYKFHPPQTLFAGTHELLFRVRPWVREAAGCVMRGAGLHGGGFVVVHARHSAEKKKERGSTLPPLSAYLPSTQNMLRRANDTRVFLQTSTPEAVGLFEGWSRQFGWNLSYTRNARSTHDLWVTGSGKHSVNHTGERVSVVAQAVNAYIAGRSHHFLSPCAV